MASSDSLSKEWNRISCKNTQLNLERLLFCGQSFTWKETGHRQWSNVIDGRLYTVSQSDLYFFWRTVSCQKSNENYLLKDIKTESSLVLPNNIEIKAESKEIPVDNSNARTREISKLNDCKAFTESSCQPDTKRPKMQDVGSDSSETAKLSLRKYFALDIDLENLYSRWSAADRHFDTLSKSFQGIRMLQQDPVENLFSFICSSNNHISRISGMVNKLCEHFGSYIGTIQNTDFYSFPSPAQLAVPGVEQKLRELSFGYRAKFIAETALILSKERPSNWLEGLRSVPYKECIEELMKLPGVGRKVADCVSLMSLNKPNAVPVDTHVLQIALRDYNIPGLPKTVKSLTPKLHDTIGDYFVGLFGEYAGWAHTVLFTADLKQFSTKAAGNGRTVNKKKGTKK